MRLFILAAGKGTRLWPLTKNYPKVLIDFGDGFSLLENHINRANECGYITEIVVITGYLHEKIEKFLSEVDSAVPIKTSFNPFYDLSNNLLSLWMVRKEMLEGDFVITNGDNLYKQELLKNFIAEKAENEIRVAIDYKSSYDDDDMKVSFNEKNEITRIHKDIDLNDTKAESVGLCSVTGNQREVFVAHLEALAKDETYRNKFWLEVFNHLIAHNKTVEYTEVSVQGWNEMDFHPDIADIKAMINKSSFRK